MIINPGTYLFDPVVSAHTAIVTNALAPSAAGSPTDLSNNPAADVSSL